MLFDETRYDAWVLAIAMIGLLWAWHHNTKNKTRLSRRAMFDECRAFLDQTVLDQDGVGFPVLSACYRGHRIRLEPIIDQVVFRKLPSLWMSVTVYQSVPVEGVLDYLVRPQNTEFYSPWSALPVDLDIPAEWPQHAVLRSNTERTWPLNMMSPTVALFEDDLTMKEMLVSQYGTRLVYQADQSQRSHYLVLRQPLFENLKVDAKKLRAVLDAAIGLAETLDGDIVAPEGVRVEQADIAPGVFAVEPALGDAVSAHS